MQKATLSVLLALVFVASVSNAGGEKKPPDSKQKYKWEVKIPYLEDSKIQVSSSFPIAKETPRTVIPTAISFVPRTQVLPSVTKKFDWNVDIRYSSASGPSTQILNLKVDEKKDEHLILERKMNQNLDWSFYNWENGWKREVKAHKSILLKHSTYVLNMCRKYAEDKNGEQLNSILFDHPMRIVEIVMTLLYEHSVNTKKSDYDSIMLCARKLQIDGLIEIAKDEVSLNIRYLR